MDECTFGGPTFDCKYALSESPKVEIEGLALAYRVDYADLQRRAAGESIQITSWRLCGIDES